MPIRLETQSRDEFITLGKVVARVLRDRDPQKQWVISLEGSTQSGKSILALACDEELNPDRYPDGITVKTNVHHNLGLYAKGRPAIFFSDGLPEIFRRRVEARKWQRFISGEYNSHLKFTYLSNVWNWTILSNNATDNDAFAKNKIPVQLRISVEAKQGDFVRGIKLTSADPDIENKIKTQFDQALKLLQPAVPRRDRNHVKKPDGTEAG